MADALKRRWLLIAAPLVAGHLGCLALPGVALALGVMPVCGQASLEWLAWNVRVALGL
jgi:hypothetical protein